MAGVNNAVGRQSEAKNRRHHRRPSKVFSFDRRRRPVTARRRAFRPLACTLGGVLVAMSSIPAGVASARTNPLTVDVVSPAYYQQEPLAPLQASGTAASNVTVTGVAIGVYTDRTAALVAQGQAKLTSLDATHVSWSWQWTTPSPGGYKFVVTATDRNGIKFKSTVVLDVSDSSGQAFLTLLAGRTADAVAVSCRPLAGAVPITQVADSLHQLGISGVGAVVTGWIQEVTHACVESAIYPSWAELASMRDVDGWSFVSEGPDHGDVTSLTPAQQYAAACGSLLPLLAHGHTRPWGLFAYPSNNFTMTMQTTITDRCYAYGRTYRPRRNHLEDLGFPYLQNSVNIDGGACNDLSQPCATVLQKRYFSLDRLGQLMQSGPGEWTVLQSYKFVTGKSGGLTSATPAWDCTSPDWHEHWSNSLEVYCWNDYLGAVKTIPSSVTVTDPASVAAAWNQRPAPPRTSFTTGVAATTTSGDATWTFTADDPRSWFTCSADHATAQLCDSGFAITGLRPGPHSLDVTAVDSFGQSGAPATWNWTVNATVATAPAADTTLQR
jgi:hypothetical protein